MRTVLLYVWYVLCRWLANYAIMHCGPWCYLMCLAVIFTGPPHQFMWCDSEASRMKTEYVLQREVYIVLCQNNSHKIVLC